MKPNPLGFSVENLAGGETLTNLLVIQVGHSNLVAAYDRSSQTTPWSFKSDQWLPMHIDDLCYPNDKSWYNRNSSWLFDKTFFDKISFEYIHKFQLSVYDPWVMLHYDIMTYWVWSAESSKLSFYIVKRSKNSSQCNFASIFGPNSFSIIRDALGSETRIPSRILKGEHFLKCKRFFRFTSEKEIVLRQGSRID